MMMMMSTPRESPRLMCREMNSRLRYLLRKLNSFSIRGRMFRRERMIYSTSGSQNMVDMRRSLRQLIYGVEWLLTLSKRRQRLHMKNPNPNPL